MARSSWNRVGRDCPCPVCEKVDWCLISADGSAVICGRVDSERRCGQAGWLHRLTNDWTPVQWIHVQKPEPTKPAKDLEGIHQRCRRSLRPESLGWLSNELGITPESIEAFEVGFHPEKNVFSFPMRRPNGTISGIRYRAYSGSKFSETGGREGLFFDPGSLDGAALLVVEGATDAMASRDIGFSSVIGRSNCTGNKLQIVTLCRRQRSQQVIVIPDNDRPGIQGASELLRLLLPITKAELVRLPGGIKDVRACIQQQKNADWLAIRIGESLAKS